MCDLTTSAPDRGRNMVTVMPLHRLFHFSICKRAMPRQRYTFFSEVDWCSVCSLRQVLTQNVHPYRGTSQVRVLAPKIDRGHDRGTPTTAVGTDEQYLNTHVLHRPTEDLRLRGPRALPWEVLAQFGVPSRIIKVIRIFHNGIRTRVQLDGELSA